ncbi:MAG: hypothetical protein H6737_08935 [Alphaproteobacteria bacterium]|nr:hypothetical protein [Alphaproteobacteria bacterium]
MSFAWVAAALAGVEVADPHGCVDADRLDDELRLQLGDPMVDHLGIRVEAEEASEGVRFRTTVREGDTTLWARTTGFAEADCPAVPEAIALSVSQGLAALPGWSFEPRASGTWLSPTVHLALSAGVPVDARFGAHVGVRVRGPGPSAFWVQARVQTGPPFEVGSGAATIVQPALAAGPVLTSRARLAPEAWVLVAGGPLFAFGSRFDTDAVAVLPRLTAEVGAGLHPGGPAQVGLFAEVPLVRVRLEEAGGEGRTEAPVRVGLTVGLVLGDDGRRTAAR